MIDDNMLDAAIKKINSMSVEEFEKACIEAGYKPVRKNLYELRTDEPLHVRMIALADRDNLPDEHPMRTKASALGSLFSGPKIATAREILGAWARARKVWCAYTGEPLI